MDLEQLSQILVEQTGRPDLIEGTRYGDAKYFLNAGQRYLDERVDFTVTPQIALYAVDKEQDTKHLELCKKVIQASFIENCDNLTRDGYEEKQPCPFTVIPFANEVGYKKIYRGIVDHTHPSTGQVVKHAPKNQYWHQNDRWSATGRHALHCLTLDEVNRAYKVGYKNIPIGIPRHYTLYMPSKLRREERNVPFSLLTTTSMNSQVTVLKMYPKPKAYGFLEIVGQFYTPPFEKADDTSYWSVNHPQLLINAARMQLEVAWRNYTGVRDFEYAIMRDIDEINKGKLDQQLVEQVPFPEG